MERRVATPVLFGLTVLGVLMASVDNTILAVALPHLTTALHTQLVDVGWTITAYQLMQALMMPVVGKISDTLGRKRVFVGCIVVFTVGSLCAAVAPSIWFLIAARVLQGIGGGGLLPSATGLVTDLYRDRRAQAVGLISSIMPIGGILGPSLGGFILEHWTWRDLFLINVPIGILVAVAVTLFFPGRRAEGGSRLKVDTLGLALYASAMLVFLIAVSSAGSHPAFWHSPFLYGCVAASIVVFGLFLRHIRRSKNPVFDYDLVARHPFTAVNMFNVFIGVSAMGMSAFLPTYAITHFGLGTFQSGVVLLPRNIAMIGASAISSLLLIRRSYHLPLLMGVGCMATGLLLLSSGVTHAQLGPWSLDGFWTMALILAFSGLGMGFLIPAASNSALDLAPNRAAAITGVRGAFRQSGGVASVTGIVVALTLFSSEGAGLTVIFRVLAAVTVCIVGPLVFFIPDTVRRMRQEGQAASE